MSDLYIDDDEFVIYKEKVSTINLAIENRLEKILQQLQSALESVSEGTFHNNLSIYREKLMLMRNQLTYMTTELHINIDLFCEKIENIDIIY